VLIETELNEHSSRKDYLLFKYLGALLKGLISSFEEFYKEHAGDLNDLRLLVKLEPEMLKH
jgi:hypothetical protein